MATLPPDPYGPDPVIAPDGTAVPTAPLTPALPGPENAEPPKLSPDEIADVPVNRPLPLRTEQSS